MKARIRPKAGHRKNAEARAIAYKGTRQIAKRVSDWRKQHPGGVSLSEGIRAERAKWKGRSGTTATKQPLSPRTIAQLDRPAFRMRPKLPTLGKVERFLVWWHHAGMTDEKILEHMERGKICPEGTPANTIKITRQRLGLHRKGD